MKRASCVLIRPVYVCCVGGGSASRVGSPFCSPLVSEAEDGKEKKEKKKTEQRARGWLLLLSIVLFVCLCYVSSPTTGYAPAYRAQTRISLSVYARLVIRSTHHLHRPIHTRQGERRWHPMQVHAGSGTERTTSPSSRPPIRLLPFDDATEPGPLPDFSLWV